MDEVFFLGFLVLVVSLLFLDLGVFHRRDHEIKTMEAIIWTSIWISLALIFNLAIWLWQGHEMALQFLTGYLIEKSLSIDNIFVFSIIFAYFHVPKKYMHRVLFWGILSALVMRGLMIALGIVLFAKFIWMTYIFGIFLILTGIKLFFEKKEAEHLEQRFFVRICKKIIPFTSKYHGSAFFIKENTLKATPLFLVLIILEASDLIFAIDSIPAIFAITKDPFIVYTSNIFAILGLRSLYFVLANILTIFHYLKYGLSTILCFVGIKMLLSNTYKISSLLSLLIILSILVISMICSVIWHPQEDGQKNLE